MSNFETVWQEIKTKHLVEKVIFKGDFPYDIDDIVSIEGFKYKVKEVIQLSKNKFRIKVDFVNE